MLHGNDDDHDNVLNCGLWTLELWKDIAIWAYRLALVRFYPNQRSYTGLRWIYFPTSQIPSQSFLISSNRPFGLGLSSVGLSDHLADTAAMHTGGRWLSRT